MTESKILYPIQQPFKPVIQNSIIKNSRNIHGGDYLSMAPNTKGRQIEVAYYAVILYDKQINQILAAISHTPEIRFIMSRSSVRRLFAHRHQKPEFGIPSWWPITELNIYEAKCFVWILRSIISILMALPHSKLFGPFKPCYSHHVLLKHTQNSRWKPGQEPFILAQFICAIFFLLISFWCGNCFRYDMKLFTYMILLTTPYKPYKNA